MKIKQLFPKFDLPVKFENLNGDWGNYWFKSDCIVLDLELKEHSPSYSKIIFLHEMIHSTMHKKRLFRLERLQNNFGAYIKGSLAYRVEECIADIGCMVASLKLGLFNEYSKTIILQGFEQNYTKDMYIPIREVRAALKYFADDYTSFESEINEARIYLEAYMDIKFQDSYDRKEASA